MTKSVLKLITAITTGLMLFYFAVPAGAWSQYGECCYWDGEEFHYIDALCSGCCKCGGDCDCTSDPTKCPPCHFCIDCDCENYCDPGEVCCDWNCCDPDTEVCCDGVCKPKCDEEDDETTCSPANDVPCISCQGFFGNCALHWTLEHTGVTIYTCSGGCDGDCDPEDPKPMCYQQFWCKTSIKYPLAECSDMSETGPVPLDCYPGEIAISCYKCGPNYNSPAADPYRVDSVRCP